MREIKFRQYRKQTKTFHYWGFLEPNEFIGPERPTWPSEQFTDLLDKNGKNVYENDICRAPHNFGPGGFHERTFVVRWDNQQGYQWNYWDLSKLEQLGNIHQNPELLK